TCSHQSERVSRAALIEEDQTDFANERELLLILEDDGRGNPQHCGSLEIIWRIQEPQRMCSAPPALKQA
ncbi:MAG: hypothetical protein MUO87_05020, partial [Thermoplasmata archaeon]|nr:hypothetical protein [Thermoplasmata archaeon]